MLTSRIASRFAKHPLYLQVRDAMAERIAAGEWKPSATIPNEGDLAREFGVAPERCARRWTFWKSNVYSRAVRAAERS